MSIRLVHFPERLRFGLGAGLFLVAVVRLRGRKGMFNISTVGKVKFFRAVLPHAVDRNDSTSTNRLLTHSDISATRCAHGLGDFYRKRRTSLFEPCFIDKF